MRSYLAFPDLRDSEQFYGVAEVLEPRSNRVSDAGVQREYNP